MGLGIYKYEVVTPGKEDKLLPIGLYYSLTNIFVIKLLNKFHNFLTTDSGTCPDISGLLKGYNKTIDDIAEEVWVNEDEVNLVLNDGTIIKDVLSLAKEKTYMDLALPIKHTGHCIGKSSIRDEYFERYTSGCWYTTGPTNLPEDLSMDIITNNEQLDILKKYGVGLVCNWVLKDNEFIELSY